MLGSEGFVGSPLCEHLIALGEEVVRFDIKRSSMEDGRSAALNLEAIDRVYFLAWEVGGAKYLAFVYWMSTQKPARIPE